MSQLIATDLDGTLLNHQHTISPYTQQVFQRLEQQGKIIVIATGRHYLDVRLIKQKLDVSCWLITTNGACIHSPEEELLHEEVLPTVIAQDLMRRSYPTEITLSIYTPTAWLMMGETTIFDGCHADSGFDYQLTDFASYPAQDVTKVILTGDAAILEPIEQQLLQQYGTEVAIMFSGSSSLEVSARKATKGQALKLILDRLQIDPISVVAFGDNMNDEDMLALVGKPYLMGDASPRLRAALPHVPVIGSCDADSEAKILEQLFGS